MNTSFNPEHKGAPKLEQVEQATFLAKEEGGGIVPDFIQKVIQSIEKGDTGAAEVYIQNNLVGYNSFPKTFQYFKKIGIAKESANWGVSWGE